jgi:peptidoglycan/xylan/chitin deacetylase (PgdA/CDA1 family)
MSIGGIIRDVIIFKLSVLGVSYLYRHRLQKKAPLVRVLVFHDVQNAEWFDGVLSCITKEYQVITPEDMKHGRFHPSKINVLITFDDGYTSWVSVCLPILKKYGVKALFFANSGLIDVADDEVKRSAYVRERLLLRNRTTISWDGIRSLVEEGHTIGGHTVSHARLSTCSHPELVEEIKKDKERIEVATNTTLTHFAYPFGNARDYTEEAMKVVAESGYTHAYTTEGVFVDVEAPYRISRMCIEDNQGQGSLKRWIEGGYDLYRMMKKLCVR